MGRKTFYFLVPLVVTIASAIFIGDSVIEYYCSPNSVFLWMNLSSYPYCSTIVLVTHIVIGSAILLGIIILPGFLFQKTKDGIRRRSLQIAARREQQKIMTLTKVEPYDNRYDLRSHNNEDSFIVLTEVIVFDRNGTRSRVSVRPTVQVGSGSSQTTTFMAEDVKSEPPHFFIIGHTDGVSYKTDYPMGIHKFDIAISYDSYEKKFQGSIKRFRVTVNYKARHDLEIDIEDPDKK
jgi:hypothetical protein